MNPSRRRAPASNESTNPTPRKRRSPDPALPPPPELVQVADKMLEEADRACKDASQIDPAWGFERRRTHFAHAIRLLCDVERMAEPFGGKDAAALRARAEAIRQAVLAAETYFRAPAPPVRRAPGAARFLADVRRLAAGSVGGTTAGRGVWEAIVVHDALRGIVRALDDFDRCLAAGKPARLRLVAWPLAVEPAAEGPGS